MRDSLYRTVKKCNSKQETLNRNVRVHKVVVACWGLGKPSANSFIWINGQSQLLYLDGWPEPTPWFGWITRANSLIWMDGQSQFVDLNGWPEPTS